MKYELRNNATSFIESDNSMEIISPPETDYFIDICSDYKLSNAPFYYTVVKGDFIFRCEVLPELNETFDAGGLFVYESDTKWIKFAYEKTDLGYSSLVLVVTNKTSDDCNGEIINDKTIWM